MVTVGRIGSTMCLGPRKWQKHFEMFRSDKWLRIYRQTFLVFLMQRCDLESVWGWLSSRGACGRDKARWSQESGTLKPSNTWQNATGEYWVIYPSQRQNLLPTLEISTQNFHNFQNFGKKFQNLEFFSKISKSTKGPPLTSKGPPPPHYPITKFSFFSKSFQSSGYIT